MNAFADLGKVIINEPKTTPEPDPFVTAIDEPKPEPAPAAELPPVEPAEFTGVRIYGDPKTCDPCRFLLSDLQFLRDFHRWTLSDSADVVADWQFLPSRGTERRLPLIEIYEGGRLIDCDIGYCAEPDFEMRRESLRELVASHPRNWSQK